MEKNNNNTNDINTNSFQNQNQIVNTASECDNKNGFFGTIDAFQNLASKIGPVSLDKLFGQKHEIGKGTFRKTNDTSMRIDVTYTHKKENVAYESTEDRNDDMQTVKTKTVYIFLPVVFDKDIEQSIKECEQYIKLMWKKYSSASTISEEDKNSAVYKKYKTDFESGQNNKYTVENFKYQCEFFSALIDAFIDKYHLKPPERKRAASIFFYILMGVTIIFWGFCIFAPGLLIPLIFQFCTLLGITTEIASQIVYGAYIFAPIIAIIFFKLARHVSWKQNDYEKPFEIRDNENQPVINEYPESYSKYNEELKRHKIGCVNLTGERCKIGEYQYNYADQEQKSCPLYNYYHDEKGELRKNTKTPLELLLKLKKAYEIPEQFKNTEPMHTT